MSRRLAALVLAIVLTAPATRPLGTPIAAAAAPQTGDAGDQPPCKCPVIAPVATDDKPATGKGYAELSLADLEWAFSDLELKYNGDWDQAMLALAHQVDPSGALKIWDQPVPPPANPRAKVNSGAVVDYLLNGPPARLASAPPPRPVAPPARPTPTAPSAPAASARGGFSIRPPAAPPPVTLTLPSPPVPAPASGDSSRDPHAMSELSAGSGSMAAVLYTIARINKYGEPQFGLRKATLRAARFLADDLGRIPLQLTQHDPNAARVGRVGVDARLVLVSMLQSQWLPQASRYVEGFPHLGDRLFIIEHQSSYPDKSVDGDLKVDAFDLASAALDVIFSVDDKGVQSGMLHFFGARPLDADGRPIMNGPDSPQAEAFMSIGQSLVHIAAKRAMFGGSAAPGSPEDALACKAYATLVALMQRADGNLLRSMVFNASPAFGSIGNDGSTLPTAEQCAGCYQVAASARIVAGIPNEVEAKLLADALVGTFTYHRIDERYGDNLPQIAQTAFVTLIAPLEPKATKPLAMARNFMRYSHGAGLATFGRRMDEHFDRIAASSAASHQLAARTRAAAATATLPSAREFLNTNASYAEGASERAQSYVNAWKTAKPDLPAQLIDPCAAPAAPPNVRIFVKTHYGLVLVGHFFSGVPLVLGIPFDEPYDKFTYPVSVKIGGRALELTATPYQGDMTFFVTESFEISR